MGLLEEIVWGDSQLSCTNQEGQSEEESLSWIGREIRPVLRQGAIKQERRGLGEIQEG